MTERKSEQTPEQDTIDEAAIEQVEETRITLVDDQDEEYEFLILDEMELEGKTYLALASCDEKTDMGNGLDPGEANDITVVRRALVDGEPQYFAVNDADELYAVAQLVDERFGHLADE